MINRELTYYSLLSSESLRHIESVADDMDQKSFINLGFEDKWLHHLWIAPNNEAFLNRMGYLTDLLTLDASLSEQLKLYARKRGEGYEKDKGDFYATYKARKNWLAHTIFICKNEYSVTKKEIYNEIVQWCISWQNEWLETFNPYSPDDQAQLAKKLKKPLWQELDESISASKVDAKDNLTRSLITDQLDSMDKNGWRYAFKSESDYNMFTELLTNYFEFKEYQIPNSVTELKRGCKTRLAGALGRIQSQLSNSDTLSGDEGYFKIVRSLNHFANLSKDQLYKDLSRFRKFD
jgi:hypothetical protein